MEGLKFRAWHKEEKKYWDVLQINFQYKTVSVHLNEESSFYWELDIKNVIIEQFTGLHDKNHKEIYEGDIVRLGEMGELLVIDYLNIHYLYDIKALVDFKVVGNIHEEEK